MLWIKFGNLKAQELLILATDFFCVSTKTVLFGQHISVFNQHLAANPQTNSIVSKDKTNIG